LPASTAAYYTVFNPLNTELNPTCHLLALLGAHHILHVSRIRAKDSHVTVDCEGAKFTCILSSESTKIMEVGGGGGGGGEEVEDEEEEKSKEAKVLGEECSGSEYIYYKETDRNFCGEARLSFWKRKVGDGVKGWGIKMLKKKWTFQSRQQRKTF